MSKFSVSIGDNTKRPKDASDASTRPACPHCGSRNVLARVKGFFCRRCGREWEAATVPQTAPQGEGGQ